MVSLLDNELCKELANHVETLTHTGQKTLDSAILKKIKNICKLSDGYVNQAYHVLECELEKQHAEIRYSAFQICNELFRRSHCFREQLISNLQHVIELTAETSPDRPLPPPRAVALNLKRLALQTFQEWNKEYGEGYKKLQLGYNFLKHCKKVDFSALEMENSAQRAREQELERRQNIMNQDRLKKVTKEIDEIQPDIMNTITAMDNCIALLLPSPDDFFIVNDTSAKEDNSPTVTKDKVDNQNLEGNIKSESLIGVKKTDTPSSCDTKDKEEEEEKKEEDDSDESDEEPNVNFRAHGMLNAKYSIEIQVNPGDTTVKETSENAAIFENARDLYALINNRYLPSVKKWVQIITKSSGNSDQLKKIIDLKRALEDSLKKYNELNIVPATNSGGDSSDSDFEEVEEKDGYEDSVREELPTLEMTKGTTTSSKVIEKKQSDWTILPRENHEKDPTTAQSTLKTLGLTKSTTKSNDEGIKDKSKNNEKSTKKSNNRKEMKDTHKPTGSAANEPQPSTSKATSSGDSRKEKLLAVAPKLPFDIDLYHWEDEHLTAPTMLAVKAEGARFWSATSTDDLEEVPVPDGSASLRTRVIEFTGSYEPVKWACRAPLSNGKLCPRRDRHKCPFHGPVVARDETGKCSNPEDAAKLEIQAEEEQQQCPDWQDPQLLQEIKEATGMDLKMPEKKKKGKKKTKKDPKKKFPGLTDINAKQNTSIARLSKKIFKKDAVKRVARALDRADHKRFRDKYGDQFNYMHSTV